MTETLLRIMTTSATAAWWGAKAEHAVRTSRRTPHNWAYYYARLAARAALDAMALSEELSKGHPHGPAGV